MQQIFEVLSLPKKAKFCQQNVILYLKNVKL